MTEVVVGEAEAPLLLAPELLLDDEDVDALLLPQAAKIEATMGTPAPTVSDRRIRSRRLSRPKRDSKSDVPFDLVTNDSSLLEIVKQPSTLPVPPRGKQVQTDQRSLSCRFVSVPAR